MPERDVYRRGVILCTFWTTWTRWKLTKLHKSFKFWGFLAIFSDFWHFEPDENRVFGRRITRLEWRWCEDKYFQTRRKATEKYLQKNIFNEYNKNHENAKNHAYVMFLAENTDFLCSSASLVSLLDSRQRCSPSVSRMQQSAEVCLWRLMCSFFAA